MHLYSLVIPECICRIYAENTKKQFDDTLRMHHNRTTPIVLTTYTALCGLHRTAYVVSTETHYNIYTCSHAYTPRDSMRKTYKNSMMISTENSMMISTENRMMILIKNSMMILFKICIMIILQCCSGIMIYQVVYAETSEKQQDD